MRTREEQVEDLAVKEASANKLNQHLIHLQKKWPSLLNTAYPCNSMPYVLIASTLLTSPSSSPGNDVITWLWSILTSIETWQSWQYNEVLYTVTESQLLAEWTKFSLQLSSASSNICSLQNRGRAASAEWSWGRAGTGMEEGEWL